MIAVVCLGTIAHADTLYGAPVGSVGSTTPVAVCPTGTACYTAATNTVGFYIPLNSTDIGTYGVSNGHGLAGTYADSGSGYTGPGAALTMILKFAPLTGSLPPAAATLTISFVDLDLNGDNDPAHFTESVQFFKSDGTQLSNPITMDGTGSYGAFSYVVTGDTNTQQIVFSNIAPAITQTPFYVKLNFNSSWCYTDQWGHNVCQTGTNTPESLVAKLDYTPRVVPEPATLTMLGLSGLLPLIRRRRK